MRTDEEQWDDRLGQQDVQQVRLLLTFSQTVQQLPWVRVGRVPMHTSSAAPLRLLRHAAIGSTAQTPCAASFSWSRTVQHACCHHCARALSANGESCYGTCRLVSRRCWEP